MVSCVEWFRVVQRVVHRIPCLNSSVNVNVMRKANIPKVSSLQASQFDGSPEHTASPFLITLSNLQNVFLVSPLSTPPVFDFNFNRRGRAAVGVALGGGVSSSHRHIASEGHTSHFPFVGFGGEGSSLTIRHRHSAGVVHSPQSE